MPTNPGSKRRRYVVIAALLLVLAGALGVMILIPQERQRAVPTDNEVAQDQDQLPAEPVHAAAPRPTASFKQSPVESPDKAQSSGTPSGQPEDATLPPDQLDIVLQFQDEDGRLVPNLRFRYSVRRRKFESDSTQRGYRHLWESLDEGPRNPFEGESGADGRFVLPPLHDVEHETLTAVRIQIISPGFTIRKGGGPDREGLVGDSDFIVGVEKRGVFPVQVLTTTPVSISIEYEDGVPFVGIVAMSMPLRAANHQIREVAPGQAAIFNLPRIKGKFGFGCNADRDGFRAGNSWDFEGSAVMPHMKLVIPRDPDQCVVEVNLERWATGEAVSVEVYAGSGAGTSFGGNATGGSIWRCLRFRGTGERWVIVVRGTSGQWHSGPFQLAHREARTFHAVPSLPFSVRARFVNSDGVPIPRGCIRSLSSLYVPWQRYRRLRAERQFTHDSGFLVLSGADGIAVLGDLPSGEVEVHLETEGCEVERRVIRGEPGEVVDLGDIRLEPAKGMIEVNLLNRREGVSYWVWIHGPGGTGNVWIEKGVTKDRHLIGPLPKRPYQLFICADDGGDGGPVPNPIIEFGDGDVATLTVDVGSWLTRPEREAASTKKD